MVEALGSVATSLGKAGGFGSRIEEPARINLSEFRLMTIGDIGISPRPLGWAISPRSFEIQNQMRLERYETIVENARVAQPISSIMSQIEGIADIAWKKTEPLKTEPVKDWVSEVGTLLFWNELRAQPDMTDEVLERAYKAKADLMKRKLTVMPGPKPQAESIVSPKVSTETYARAYARTATKPLARVERETKNADKHNEKRQEKKETPRSKKLGTIVFKKDESVSAYRLARAREKLKILHQEKQGGVVFGVELNNRLGFEISEEKSSLLYQLGIKDREDGSNVNGFRRIIDRLLFNGLQDGYRKLYEANEKHDPVVIGGDGKIESEVAVEEVLQGGQQLVLKIVENAKEKITSF